jgi:hypothetical protein
MRAEFGEVRSVEEAGSRVQSQTLLAGASKCLSILIFIAKAGEKVNLSRIIKE